MAADAASQGDAPSKTADTPFQEDKLRAAAPTPPGPAKDFEEADDAFDPELTKLMAFVNIDDWAQENRKAFETSLQAIPSEVAEQVAKELQETYQQHIQTTYTVEVQAKTKIMQIVKDGKVRSASSSE